MAAETDFAMNDFQLSPPSAYPSGRTTLHRRFELWRGLSLFDENDASRPPQMSAQRFVYAYDKLSRPAFQAKAVQDVTPFEGTLNLRG